MSAFPPISGAKADIPVGPGWARSRLMHRTRNAGPPGAAKHRIRSVLCYVSSRLQLQ